MADLFDKFFSFLMKLEGGYSNHPLDKGGATNFGITQSLLNGIDYVESERVNDLTEEEAKDIYREEFFNPLCDYLTKKKVTLTYKEVYHLFDISVNSGAAKMKQILSAKDELNSIVSLRKDWYNRIVKLNPTQKVFLKGWMNRLDRIEKEFV